MSEPVELNLRIPFNDNRDVCIWSRRRHLTPEEWDYVMAVLAAMKPGIVPVATDLSPGEGQPE